VWPDLGRGTANCTPTAVDKVMKCIAGREKVPLITVISLSPHIREHLMAVMYGLVVLK
jgi:hypothetical protein